MAIEHRNPLFHCDSCAHVEEMGTRDAQGGRPFPEGSGKIMTSEMVNGKPVITHQHLCGACYSRLKGFLNKPKMRNESEILNHPAMR